MSSGRGEAGEVTVGGWREKVCPGVFGGVWLCGVGVAGGVSGGGIRDLFSVLELVEEEEEKEECCTES